MAYEKPFVPQVLLEDKEIWKRMEPAEIAASRATPIGRDGN
jgi:hypothetical protein